MARHSRLSRKERIRRFCFRWSRKRQLLGLTVGVFLEGKEAERKILDKVEQALLLVRTFDARRFARIQRDVQGILIFGSPGSLGTWLAGLRLIELDNRYVTAPLTSAADIASTLVHEGSHAYLMRLGFGYEEPDRLQVERICFKAQIAFARRLPLGGPQREEAERKMAYYGSDYFSSTNLLEVAARANVQNFRDLGCPAWMVRLLERSYAWRLRNWQKRAARAKK